MAPTKAQRAAQSVLDREANLERTQSVNGSSPPMKRRTRVPYPPSRGSQKRGPPPPVMVEYQPSRPKRIQSFAQRNRLVDSFLAGFVNPEVATRGPGMLDRPTIVVNFRCRAEINLRPHVVGPYYPASVDHTVDASGGIALVVAPHVVTDTAFTGTNIESGFTYNNDGRPLSAAHMYNPSVAGLANTVPLGQFDCPFPGGWTNDGLQATMSMPFRTVGLRATLTVTTNPLHVQGSIVCGDNGDLFAQLETETVAQSNSDIVTDSLAVGRNPLVGQAFGTGFSYARLNQAGPLLPGATYEAAWLPSTDRALEYQHSVNLHRVPAVVDNDQQNAADELVEGPALIFLLRGMQVTPVISFTATLNITWAVEIGIQRGSALAFLYNSARFAPRYVVDWSELVCTTTGGPVGAAWRNLPGPVRSAAGEVNSGVVAPNNGMGAVTTPSMRTATRKRSSLGDSGHHAAEATVDNDGFEDRSRVVEFAEAAGTGAAIYQVAPSAASGAWKWITKGGKSGWKLVKAAAPYAYRGAVTAGRLIL